MPLFGELLALSTTWAAATAALALFHDKQQRSEREEERARGKRERRDPEEREPEERDTGETSTTEGRVS